MKVRTIVWTQFKTVYEGKKFLCLYSYKKEVSSCVSNFFIHQFTLLLGFNIRSPLKTHKRRENVKSFCMTFIFSISFYEKDNITNRESVMRKRGNFVGILQRILFVLQEESGLFSLYFRHRYRTVTDPISFYFRSHVDRKYCRFDKICSGRKNMEIMQEPNGLSPVPPEVSLKLKTPWCQTLPSYKEKKKNLFRNRLQTRTLIFIFVQAFTFYFQGKLMNL